MSSEAARLSATGPLSGNIGAGIMLPGRIFNLGVAMNLLAHITTYEVAFVVAVYLLGLGTGVGIARLVGAKKRP